MESISSLSTIEALFLLWPLIGFDLDLAEEFLSLELVKDDWGKGKRLVIFS